MNLPRGSHIAKLVMLMTLDFICLPPLAAGRSGGMSHPDGASTRHVDELPPQIRKALSRWQSACGAPLAAKPLFALALSDKISGYRLISLHFHELSCVDRAALCTREGCLHQVYISADGGYRLAFSANVPEVTMRFLDHTATIEIECEPFGPQCPRVLRWNGRRFVGH